MRSGCIDPRFLTSALVGYEWLASLLSRFTGAKAIDAHWIGVWVDPSRSGRCGEAKILDTTRTRTAALQINVDVLYIFSL
jgi:hypothetical protein